MKAALVVGMARSGVASAHLLYRNGWQVIINDSRVEIDGLQQQLKDIEYIDALGRAPEDCLQGVELMVLSPGVSMFQPFVEYARGRGVEVIGEIELGYRYAKGAFLCITGTNGKTTSTALTGEICKRSGKRTFVLGNIGEPITQYAEQTRDGDWIVAETAALQLEGNVQFHAHVAAVTNIQEDHLDRFLTMEYYTAVKSKIFLNQTKEDFAVLNYDDPVTRGMASGTEAQVVYFSRKTAVEQGVYCKDGEVLYNIGGKAGRICRADEIRIPGVHNLENAMLSSAIGLCAGVPPEEIAEALRTFPGVEHRIEYVCEKKGVRYINDSKGTNPDSTRMAIAAMDRPIVLLLGGYDKHSAFDTLMKEIKASGRVKAMVILGETAKKLIGAANEVGAKNVHLCEHDFKQAVDMARDLAEPGDVVLLSPACASWDMFENFEQRGRIFKEIVAGYEE